MTDENAKNMALKIVSYMQSKKAHNVILMDLKGISGIADYFIVCHADTDVQVKAIAGAVLDGMSTEGFKVWHKEGYDYLHWVLLDYVDTVVHIFQRDDRKFYGLERLWGDARHELFQDEAG